jgi:hypothetical protein
LNRDNVASLDPISAVIKHAKFGNRYGTDDLEIIAYTVTILGFEIAICRRRQSPSGEGVLSENRGDNREHDRRYPKREMMMAFSHRNAPSVAKRLMRLLAALSCPILLPLVPERYRS